MRSALFALVVCACLAPSLSGCRSKSGANDAPLNANTGAEARTNISGNVNASDEGATAPIPQLPEGSDANAYFDRGIEAYKNNRDAEAVELFKEATRLDPGFAEAHYRLGLAYSATGQDDESEKAFEQAVKSYKDVVKRNPKDAGSEYMLGLAYGKLGKYEDAVKVLKESVKNDPADDDKFYELGLAHSKLAQYREAVAAFNKALELNPDNFPAVDALEKAKAGLERREAFLKQQEKLRKAKGKPANSNANMNANTNAGAQPAPTPGI